MTASIDYHSDVVMALLLPMQAFYTTFFALKIKICVRNIHVKYKMTQNNFPEIRTNNLHFELLAGERKCYVTVWIARLVRHEINSPMRFSEFVGCEGSRQAPTTGATLTTRNHWKSELPFYRPTHLNFQELNLENATQDVTKYVN